MIIELITIAALASAQTVSSSQDDTSEVSVRIESFSVFLDLPDDIGFAFSPYIECMSREVTALSAAETPLHENPHKVDEIKIMCSKFRDEAIYLAATALERIEQIENIEQNYLDVRRKKILSTLKSAEDFVLDTRDPAVIFGLEN